MKTLNRIFQYIKTNFPYAAGALALTAGFAAYTLNSTAERDETKELPLIRQSMNWPNVKGVITGHDISEITYGYFSHSPLVHYIAEPSYIYTIKGRTYKGNRLSFYHDNNGTGAKSINAERILKQYPIGSAVRVYYSPDRPSFSTLIPGSKKSESELLSEISFRNFFFKVFTVISVILTIVTVLTAKEFRE